MNRRSFLRTAGGAAAMLGARHALADAAGATAMPRRRLGRTGWDVSVVGFSGFALKHYDQPRCTEALHRAFDRGVNYYDVAPAYDNGNCEIRMGLGLQGVPRDRYYLACKTKKRDRDGAREELERSLERLKTDHFDVYQFHHLVKPDDIAAILAPGGAMETVLKAKEQGKVRAIGFSAHTTKGALAALEAFPFDTVMFPVNYVEWFTRGFAKEVVDLAQRKGAAVLSIKTLNAGAWPQGAERVRKWWYRTLEDHDSIGVALRWTLSLPGVVTCFPPSWLDLQERSIDAALALRPAVDADAAHLRAMAEGCGSIFQREEALVAHGRDPGFFYADAAHVYG